MKNSRLKRTQLHCILQYLLEVYQFPEYDEPYITECIPADKYGACAR